MQTAGRLKDPDSKGSKFKFYQENHVMIYKFK